MSPDGAVPPAGTGRNGRRTETGAYPFRYPEQYAPPEPERVTDVALTTFEHVYEVDPRLMQAWVLQQTFPNWDSLRIMNSRHQHLDWMHRHFAGRVVNGSSVLAELDEESAAAESPTRVEEPES